MTFFMKKLGVSFAILCACALVAGCNNKPKQRVLFPDINYSFNVMAVPDDWPLEKKDWPVDPTEAAVRQAVYEREGAPDYFRFRWRKDAKPVTRREVTEMLFVKDKSKRDLKSFTKGKDLTMDWVYKDKGEVYTFTKKGAEKSTLPDEIRIICEYGDPQEIKSSVDVRRLPVTIYQYYNEGKVYYFTDGKLTREETQPRMEGMYERR
ncbi:hypothetical protein IT570_03110 [Candidatus Sumerlaeota bacterium]|nr:hypothetical protein [Candidatus Sumerlaeota bacterium]